MHEIAHGWSIHDWYAISLAIAMAVGGFFLIVGTIMLKGKADGYWNLWPNNRSALADRRPPAMDVDIRHCRTVREKQH